MSQALAVDFFRDTVPTVAALRALPKPTVDGARAYCSGFHAANDGGGDWFFWGAAATETPNAGTIYQSDEGGAGRWFRLYFGREVKARWFGMIADGESHPLEDFFPGDLAAAQAVYPNATDLSDELDGTAIQAAGDLILGTPGQSTNRGGVVEIDGTPLFNVLLDFDRCLGFKLRGLANGALSGTASGGGTLMLWTGETVYKNPSNAAPAIRARSSYGFEMENINLAYTKPGYFGHLVDLSHHGGNTRGIWEPLPTITFAGHVISRPSGSFRDDGWEVGMIVRVLGSALNDSNNGVITEVAEDGLSITTAATTWASESVDFTEGNGPYSAYPDTQFAKFTNCHLVQDGPIEAGTGAKALLSLAGAIFCSAEGSFFGTAVTGVLFRDFGYGSGVYSNSHAFNDCRWGYNKWSAASAGQHVTFKDCGFEGLGGVQSALYVDFHARTKAQVECTFTFDPIAKTVTRSSGDFTTEGWSVGKVARYIRADGWFGSLGTITALTATVMTTDGTFPTGAVSLPYPGYPFYSGGVPQATYDFQLYNDTEGTNGIRSSSQLGNTLEIVGDEIHRNDGLSFKDDGWVIAEPVFGPGGGGLGAVRRVTDDVLYLTTSPGDATHTSGWYIRGGGGGGTLNYFGGWAGDQYRADSWWKTLGCQGLNIHGMFIDSDARIVHNQDGELTGTIEGCTANLIRPYEGVLLEGTNGITGFHVAGGQGFAVRNLSVVSVANLSMHGNRSIVTGEAHQKVDDTFVEQVIRLVQRIRFTTRLYNPFAHEDVLSLVEVEGGDLEMIDDGYGIIQRTVETQARRRAVFHDDGSVTCEAV